MQAMERSTPEQHVQEYWRELCSELEIDSCACEKWWDIIHDHYCEPWRHYHTLNHIQDMLRHLDLCKKQLKSSQEVALAIYFHDIIYNPKASDNEEQSECLFREFAEECLTKKVNSAGVCRMILQTKSHQTDIHMLEGRYGTDDSHYILDFDMAILGQEKSIYQKYSEDIRREYIHIPLMEYCQRRIHVLLGFLQTPKIYCTAMLYQQWEDQARTNITQEVDILKQSLESESA